MYRIGASKGRKNIGDCRGIGLPPRLYGLILGLAQSAVIQSSYDNGNQGINTDTKCGTFGPFKYLSIVFGATFLGGLIFFAKGVYSSNDFMLWGGWFTAAASIIGFLLVTLGHGSLFAENVAASSVFDASATCYRRAEYIRVLPVVVPELKLRDVQSHVFGRYFVECSDHARLKSQIIAPARGAPMAASLSCAGAENAA